MSFLPVPRANIRVFISCVSTIVERFHRTLGQECLLVQLPRTCEQVNEVTQIFLPHYNDERPNQARSCGNRPPRVACPAFPLLPAVPETVDPDRWLERVNKQAFARTVQAGGGVTINHEDYYVSRALAGQRVTCFVNAAEQQVDIWQPGVRIKSVPIKGLYGRTVPFRRICRLDEAGGALRISAVSAHASQAHPRSSVGLTCKF
jgi:Integrase core domain